MVLYNALRNDDTDKKALLSLLHDATPVKMQTPFKVTLNADAEKLLRSVADECAQSIIQCMLTSDNKSAQEHWELWESLAIIKHKTIRDNTQLVRTGVLGLMQQWHGNIRVERHTSDGRANVKHLLKLLKKCLPLVKAVTKGASDEGGSNGVSDGKVVKDGSGMKIEYDQLCIDVNTQEGNIKTIKNNAQQHTATHCNTLQYTATHCNTLQLAATHCSTLQHPATHCNTLKHTATHFNTLQHTATHCNTLQHAATHCNTLQHTTTHSNKLQHTATHCNTLQHTATHCNTHIRARSHGLQETG